MDEKLEVEGNVCIFGDSIAWGANDTELGGWTNRLWLYCMNDLEQDIILYNLSIPCDTTTDLLKRIDSECKTRNPNSIIIAIGINDTSYTEDGKPKTSISDFENNIQKIIDIVRKYTGNITFVGLTPVNELITKSDDFEDIDYYDNDLIKRYDSILQKVVENNDLQYIYMFDKLYMDDLFEDGLHPNGEGHNKVFEQIKDRLF